MNHPDFRVRGHVFASLGSPDVGWATVKLTPEQQAAVIQQAPQSFRRANGAWGLKGYTNLFLADTAEADAVAALKLAVENLAKKKDARRAKR